MGIRSNIKQNLYRAWVTIAPLVVCALLLTACSLIDEDIKEEIPLASQAPVKTQFTLSYEQHDCCRRKHLCDRGHLEDGILLYGERILRITEAVSALRHDLAFFCVEPGTVEAALFVSLTDYLLYHRFLIHTVFLQPERAVFPFSIVILSSGLLRYQMFLCTVFILYTFLRSMSILFWKTSAIKEYCL